MASDDYSGEQHRRRRRRRHGSSRSEQRHREEEYEIDEGPADEESGDRRRRRSKSYGRELGIGLAALVAIVLIAGGGWYYYKTVTSPAARAFAEARDLPLVGLVIADQPDVEKLLKAAIEEDLRQPSAEGPSRQAAAVAELRNEYIAPALRRADDASLTATMAARTALLEYLNQNNTKACREFALGGIKEPDKLDAEGQRLYKNLLTAISAAYRSGRAAAQAPPMPTLQEMGNMMIQAGFAKSDFDKLNSFATLSNDMSCYIMLLVNQVLPGLKPEQRGPYSRFILGN